MKKPLILIFLMIFLGASVSSGQINRQSAQKISFDFMDADVRNVLRVLAEVSKKNIVIADDVKGKVTIKLENVSHHEAFDVILRNNDLAKIEEESIIRVMTLKKFYEEKDRGTKERLEFIKEKEAKQKLEEEFVTETVYVNYADAADVEKMVRGETSAMAKDVVQAAGGAGAPGTGTVLVEKPKGLLSPNGVVTLVKWNSALIIKDTKDNVASIVKLIKQHDIPPQQVQIEARIVQATSTFSKELGIQWGANLKSQIRGEQVTLTGSRQIDSASATGDVTFTSPTGNIGSRPGTTGNVNYPYNVNMPASIGKGAGGALGLYIGSVTDSFQLDVILSALEANGKAKIISNPKVITSENRPARITQGTQIPYQTSSSNLGTNIQFKDAVLELEVTPHVVKDGNISMKVKAKKDQPNFDSRFGSVPAIDKREAVAELLVRDGETLVLGGIYEVTQDDQQSGVPVLQNIPLLGWLFKKITKTDNKTELLIFITPTLIRNLYTEKRDK
ncbi:MAG: Type IV pilus biogenesis and competence protein PilQ precursor [Syntrophorhabdaceae bacterium PtaU1.Bin034]|jgi:type IV pilus assembly protein PilQ|nr:MAG: Type IV pilus biogenesis and competence protein PilQ precursor [Syntrophorhabdaceae bacterium PtaU1.Bin034]